MEDLMPWWMLKWWLRYPGCTATSYFPNFFFLFSPLFHPTSYFFHFFSSNLPFISFLRNEKSTHQSSEIMGVFIFPHMWLFDLRKHPFIKFYSIFKQSRRFFYYLRGSQSSLFWFILILVCTHWITNTMLLWSVLWSMWVWTFLEISKK